MPRFLATLELAGASLVVAVVLGLGAGLVAALFRDSACDAIVTATALVGISVPRFWLGMMLVLVFSVELGVLPSGGRGTLPHLVLPAIAFGWSPGALIARTTRASMLDVLDRDYIRTARAKGLRERSVVLKHALQAALLPTVTVLGLQFGFLLAGSVIVEIVFSWPGIGTLLVDSILGRDYPMVQAALLLLATCFVLVNLAIDLLYLVIDPRLRFHMTPAGRRP
jgi:ABC-type dipeptide/oligopeptide/nickel transport system permease component